MPSKETINSFAVHQRRKQKNLNIFPILTTKI